MGALATHPHAASGHLRSVTPAAHSSGDWPLDTGLLGESLMADSPLSETKAPELPSAPPDYLRPLKAEDHLSGPLASAAAVPDKELRAAFDLFADPTSCTIGREDDVELVLEHLGIHPTDEVLAGAVLAAGVPLGCPFTFDDVRTVIEYVKS